MRKILTILLVLISMLTLAACGETPEQKNEKQFKEFLAANDALTVEEFDALATQGDVELPADLFTNADIAKLHIEAVMGEDDPNSSYESVISENIYVWQNESKVYLANISSENATMAYYLDLAELELLYDQAKEEVPGLENVKPSEMIDGYLEEIMASSEVEIDLDLETILSIASFKFEDFNHIEEGKYQLKNSALFNKIALLSNGEIKAADLEKQLSDAGYSLNLYTYFDGKHINGYEFSLSMTESGLTMSMGMKLMLSFDGDNLNGYSLKANIPGTGEIELSVNLNSDAISFDAKISSYNADDESGSIIPMVITFEGRVSNENITIKAKQNNVELLNCNINFNNEKLGDVNSLSLSGSLVVKDTTGASLLNINITSGDSVTIPNEVKALESSASNLLESMGSNEIIVLE